MALPVSALAGGSHRVVAFAGKGHDYLNNAPRWVTVPRLREPFRFGFDPARHVVTGFHGSFFFYCGAGTEFVRSARIPVARNGSFTTHFSVPTRLQNGTYRGRTYGSITGSLIDHDRAARVSYLVVFGTAHPRHDPYTAAGAFHDGCASWVRGVARAR